jgi:hypothetical protein
MEGNNSSTVILFVQESLLTQRGFGLTHPNVIDTENVHTHVRPFGPHCPRILIGSSACAMKDL